MNDYKKNFENEKERRIASYGQDRELKKSAKNFFQKSCFNKYTYNFSWMGVPIIQFPQDMIVMQELIFELQPDLIIETGIAHGGSLIYYASIMELLGRGRIIGVDIEIRQHNREVLENHRLFHRIELVEGSSIDESTLQQVSSMVSNQDKVVLVCLDSKHTHDHVYQELLKYSNFVTDDSYLVVFDTTAEVLDKETLEKLAENYRFKPWGKNSNPHSAVQQFLSESKDFDVDDRWHNKVRITNCYEGFLRKKINGI